MKHTQLLESLLPDGLARAMSAVTLERLLAYLTWLLEANEMLNLTAVTDYESALRLHLADSLAVVQDVEESPPGLMVDLGTGGGLPGIPLSLVTGRRTLLVDSVAKKVRAVESYLKTAGLTAQIGTFAGRSEELATSRPGLASVVVARAVAELPVLLELAAPLLSKDGRLIALKGQPEDSELIRADKVAELLGFSNGVVRRYTLAGGDSRATVVFTLEAAPSVSVPRRPGMAKKRPLA